MNGATIPDPSDDLVAVVAIRRDDAGNCHAEGLSIADRAPMPRRTLARLLRHLADAYDAQAEAVGD